MSDLEALQQTIAAKVQQCKADLLQAEQAQEEAKQQLEAFHAERSPAAAAPATSPGGEPSLVDQLLAQLMGAQQPPGSKTAALRDALQGVKSELEEAAQAKARAQAAQAEAAAQQAVPPQHTQPPPLAEPPCGR